MPIETSHLDHLVLTVADIERSCAFYQRVLGMEIITFNGGRKALKFGQQKINLHRRGCELAPAAAHPLPGSADFCLISNTPVADILRHLQACGVGIELGPVRRTGACGAIESVYFRDPDQNLIELACYCKNSESRG